MNDVVRACAGALLLALLSGCSIFRSPDGNREVTTHIAVLAVTPFDEYKQQLQPTFQLTEKQALDMAIPTVGLLGAAGLDSLRGGVDVGLDLVDGVTAPDAPTLAAPAPVRPSLKAPDTLDAISKLGKEAEISPALRFQVAQALMQRVALLNTSVSSAAIPEGCTAYVVQLQVSVMPRKRHQHLDVYADVGFFPLTQESPNRDTRGAEQANRFLPNVPSRIRVVPLLSTDTIESVVASSSADTLRSLNASVAVAVTKVRAGSSLERVLEEVRATLGRQIVSSSSVAKLSENSLRVRLGATPNGADADELAPRTHQLPVLLVVPTALANEIAGAQPGAANAIELLASAKITLVDPQSGAEEPDIDVQHQLSNAVRASKLLFGAEQKPADLLDLGYFAIENDYPRFLKKLTEMPKAPDRLSIAAMSPELIWMEFVRFIPRTQFSGTRFSLPKSYEFVKPTGAVLVEGEKDSTLLLPTLPLQALHVVHAQLNLKNGATTVQVPALSLSRAPAGGLQAVFPPTSAMKGWTTESASVWSGVVANDPRQNEVRLVILPAKEPAKQAKPLLARTTNLVRTNRGVGLASLIVDLEALSALDLPVQPASIHLVVTGADIMSVGSIPAGIANFTGKTLTVSGSGQITLELNNLSSGTAVEIKAVDEKNKDFSKDLAGRQVNLLAVPN